MKTTKISQTPFTCLREPSTCQGKPFSATWVYSHGAIPELKFKTERSGRIVTNAR